MSTALYSKQIEVFWTGMVIAKVFCGDRRVGLKFFDNFFSTVEGRCKKAHAWADKHIDICAKYEVGVPVAGGEQVGDERSGEMKKLLLAVALLSLFGCTQWVNKNHIAQMKQCTDAGLIPMQNVLGDYLCTPKPAACK